ncbi:DUF1232 domain-containing protein [Crassaminicella thermophila]|uniref:DUF1232 domain-containing protein n=1 Tax=Crassaminicella thermophila TaxID=2599308 RepID=A0A5C0SF50_CRATE|nr:DUF1232 domain-containing protein [Crassaminicella thermophila]QEK11934.1 DUF1232 domain-containing protein [Crassaminicella thermophila]
MIQKRFYTDMNVLKSISKPFKRIGVLHKLIKDPNVSFYKKIMLIGGLIYVISPIDIISDPILGFGFIDDAVLMVYIISKISDQLDKYIEKDYGKFNKEKIIEDVEYKVHDEHEH